MDNNLRIIDFYGYNETFLSPIALAITVICCVLIFRARKGSAAIPVFIVASYITYMQRIVIAGIDFDMLRVVIIVSLARIFIRNEHKDMEFNTIDRLMFFYVVLMLFMHSIQLGSFGSFVNKLGYGLDYFGGYFVVRVFLSKMEDVAYFFKIMSVLIIPITLSMIGEQITGKNIFSVIGGVPIETMLRDGRLRSQGSFSHPILAGTFGATLFPVFYSFWKTETKGKAIFLLGCISTLVITFTSSSSGPILSLVASIVALLFWRLRKYMKQIKWSFAVAYIVLSFVMKAPVYALIWRITVVSGSTGYHRYALIDQFFKHFRDWWFAGTRGMAFWGWGLQDVTNQYVLVGVDGGLFPLLVFIAIIWLGFNKIGDMIVEREAMGDMKNPYLLWAFGATIFSHAVSFMGVSYFGKMTIFWVLAIGLMSSLTFQSAFKIESQNVEGAIT